MWIIIISFCCSQTQLCLKLVAMKEYSNLRMMAVMKRWLIFYKSWWLCQYFGSDITFSLSTIPSLFCSQQFFSEIALTPIFRMFGKRKNWHFLLLLRTEKGSPNVVSSYFIFIHHLFCLFSGSLIHLFHTLMSGIQFYSFIQFVSLFIH